jgi:hypothetical protein
VLPPTRASFLIATSAAVDGTAMVVREAVKIYILENVTQYATPVHTVKNAPKGSDTMVLVSILLLLLLLDLLSSEANWYLSTYRSTTEYYSDNWVVGGWWMVCKNDRCLSRAQKTAFKIYIHDW